MSDPEILSGGFSNPVFQSQAVFRAVLDAFAKPGTVQPIPPVVHPPAVLHPAAAAFIGAFADSDTSVWLDRSFAGTNAGGWIAFQTGAPLTDDAEAASFALVGDASALSRLDAFALGTEEYPDRSATLIIQIGGFDGASPLVVEGPGVPGERSFRPDPLPASIIGLLEANRALYPRGVDLVLAAPDALAALPRSVRVRAA